MNRSGAAIASDEENIGSSQPREESAGDTKEMTTEATNDNSKDTSSQRLSSRHNKLIITFAVVIITAVIALVLILVKLWNKDGGPDGTLMTTALQIVADIVGVENLDLLNVTSPEYRALEWMAYEDPLTNDLLVSGETSEGSNRILIERFSIVVLYYATNGASWESQNFFLSDTSVCVWRGIWCNGQGMVAHIGLGHNGLSETIPLQLGKLLSLEYLHLGVNNLRGTIPSELSKLTQLTSLNVRFNVLTGTIPNELAALTQLTYLNVGYNELTGTIPEAMAALTQLTYLYVNDNYLSGTVPSTFQSLAALERLRLYNNRLTGNLDPIFCPRPTTLDVIEADCAEPDPEITCSCCTFCFE